MRGKHTHYIKDLVYGANDGIITTFAIIAGVAGAALSTSTILIVGFASLLADAFSMASSNYLGTKSECDALEGTPDACPPGRHWKGGFYTFIAFVVAGFVPLVPYLIFKDGQDIFSYAVYATAIALFIVGALRTVVTKKNPIRSGLEMLIVGGIAALIAYFVGAFVKGLVV